MMKKMVPILALAFVLAACSPQTAVTSPDGRIAVQFALDASGVPSYRVDVDGKPFLMPSAMGLSSDDATLDRGAPALGREQRGGGQPSGAVLDAEKRGRRRA